MVIHGRVVDEAGRGIVGAAVYIAASPRPVPDIAQLTGDAGAFSLAAPVAGRYVIGARADASTGEAAVDVGATDVVVQIVLKGPAV